MTPQEIGDRLVALHTALVEKIGEQPWHAPDLSVLSSGKCRVYLTFGNNVSTSESEFIHGDTFAEALDAADALIADMPTAEEHQRRKFYGDLAKVIDKGHELNLPNDVMEPLRTSAKAMTENLLTYEAAE